MALAFEGRQIDLATVEYSKDQLRSHRSRAFTAFIPFATTNVDHGAGASFQAATVQPLMQLFFSIVSASEFPQPPSFAAVISCPRSSYCACKQL